MKKNRAWVFTCNNYTTQNVSDFDKLKSQYRIRGFEVGAEGTHHIQAYAYFKHAVSFSGLQKQLPGFWFEPAMGTAQANQTYCSKQGNSVEHGEIPLQGARNDIHGFYLALKASPTKFTEGQLLENHSQILARYPLYVDRCIRHLHPPAPLEALDNYWFYGVPGTGKTTAAAKLGTHFVKFPNKWFCGYAGEDVLIIEDLEPKHASFMGHSLKLWADKAPFTAQVKGSSMYIRPKQVIVTSNYSIEEMGWDEVTTKAISRRFQVKLFVQIF